MAFFQTTRTIMNLALFFDTETTGLPDFKAPSDAPQQPHIVQLAAALVDLGTRKTIASMDVIVKPDGWTIPDNVAAIHGITTEHAQVVGIPEAMAVDMFLALWCQRLRIAHNEQFDARILRIALKRFIDPRNAGAALPMSDLWKASTSECTCLLATPICKVPPTEKMKAAGRFNHKSASLSEAYQYFMDKPLENAHSAMADVRGCIDIYFAIHDPVNAEIQPLVA
jgi:DNA polymerase-3 subunit epsilon